MKKGYKKTEVGVIPKEWEVKTLSEISEIVRGGSPRPAGSPKYFGGDYIPWLTVASLTNILDTQLYVEKTSGFLTELGSKYSRVLEKGTLIISNSGATLGVAKILSIKCCANDGIAALLNIDERINKEFIVYNINSRTKLLREVVATGNGQPNLNTNLIGKLLISTPSVSEQKNIAEALSDTDALITALSALIEKKRLIKQGTMQQLLTGKKRLVGFSGEWEVKTFGELVSLRKQKYDSQKLGSHDFCLELEHFGQGTGSILGYTETSSTSSLKNAFRKDDVLFGKLRAYLRKYWKANRDGVASSEVWVFSSNDISCSEYIFQLVQTETFIEAASETFGTHMPRSDWNIVKKLELPTPSIAEQKAIADILSDMDTELSALSAQRTKYLGIKQGMMTALLTGAIRLSDK